MQLNNKILGQIHEGCIVKMSPGFYTKNPYYVEITSICNEVIRTNIPGEHSLNITRDNNWEYQLNRMKYIGSKEDHEKLLRNQKLD